MLQASRRDVVEALWGRGAMVLCQATGESAGASNYPRRTFPSKSLASDNTTPSFEQRQQLAWILEKFHLHHSPAHTIQHEVI